ncbi:MAG TPA: phage baseplate assembly protein V, partial [Zoogloea sp.]|nr:phage baseplate assembly protein V [Zoogloea sp.]
MIPGLTAPNGTERARLYGVYPALVTDVQDPDNQGRVQIKLPFVEENDGGTALAWARLATLMAGADRGTWFIPEV